MHTRLHCFAVGCEHKSTLGHFLCGRAFSRFSSADLAALRLYEVDFHGFVQHLRFLTYIRRWRFDNTRSASTGIVEIEIKFRLLSRKLCKRMKRKQKCNIQCNSELAKCCKPNTYLQKSASTQPRTSPPNWVKIANIRHWHTYKKRKLSE